MSITTRFGSEVTITHRCDDYEHHSYVHCLRAEDGSEHVWPVWELRATAGISEILSAAAKAPLAHCTGQHDEPGMTGVDRLG